MKNSTDALIMAELEQALSTRATEARVYHTSTCYDKLAEGCKILVDMVYIERHNQVAGMVQRNSYGEY